MNKKINHLIIYTFSLIVRGICVYLSFKKEDSSSLLIGCSCVVIGVMGILKNTVFATHK